VRTSDFDFSLPLELIAQSPAPARDASRLLVLHRNSTSLEHRHFPDLLEYFRPNDVLVLNDSRVISARLRGVNAKSVGQFELLLLEQVALNDWWVMIRPGKRARVGSRIILKKHDGLPTAIEAKVLDVNEEGHRRVFFSGVPDILLATDELGEVPLPPYIERKAATCLEQDRERYQTVFARQAGSVAAPTAGLHFTERLLDRIKESGVKVCFVTLHVGLGTFAPVKAQELAEHKMHEERYEVSARTAEAIAEAKRAGGRVIAVGTTTLRVLESIASSSGGEIFATRGRTRIFIYPPYDFKVVDALLTNFHLPRSTLLMLVSAFATPGRTEGRVQVLSSYTEAIARGYRFFSYGDAMLIL